MKTLSRPLAAAGFALILAAHGALHLLGYDHERGPEDAAAMRAREEAAMALLGLSR